MQSNYKKNSKYQRIGNALRKNLKKRKDFVKKFNKENKKNASAIR